MIGGYTSIAFRAWRIACASEGRLKPHLCGHLMETPGCELCRVYVIRATRIWRRHPLSQEAA